MTADNDAAAVNGETNGNDVHVPTTTQFLKGLCKQRLGLCTVPTSVTLQQQTGQMNTQCSLFEGKSMLMCALLIALLLVRFLRCAHGVQVRAMIQVGRFETRLADLTR